MKIGIVDDEQSNRDVIEGILQFYGSGSQLYLADNVQSGVKLVKQHAPDVLFLDVEMPDGTGFDLLGRCPEFNGEVVFVTAHDEYAVNAFRFSALDYILKPIDPDHIKKALE